MNGDRLGNRLPLCNEADPAALEAWYGPFGYDEKFRKLVLANCAEIERARAASASEKISEARILDLARLHGNYLDYLIRNLNGRRLREQMVGERMGA